MLGRLLGRLKGYLRHMRTRRALARSPALFDEAWYRRAYAGRGGEGGLAHYLAEGEDRGFRPSPYFDPAWYRKRYPDIEGSRLSAPMHYLLYGAAEARDPNPYFSAGWYVAANPDAAGWPTPLDHFAAVGAEKGLDPSPRFDTVWYSGKYPQWRESGLPPFAHFLAHGEKKGHLPVPPRLTLPGEPIELARLQPFKALEPVTGGVVALMVAYTGDGRLKPNVKPLVAGLAKAGVQVVLVVTTDKAFVPDDEVTALLAGGYVRDNAGFDFAAWAHLMRAEPGLFAADTLILVNDSIVGPAGAGSVERLLDRIEASPADVLGLTESWEEGWHLQSYFLAFKRKALSTVALHAFFGEVRSLPDKTSVIFAYEVQLARRMRAAGLTCAPLFESRDRLNQTVFHWRALLDEGFPFVKTMLLAGGYPEGGPVDDWRERLAAHGFDVAVAEATVDARLSSTGKPRRRRKPKTLVRSADLAPPARPWKLAFVGPWNYANGLALASRGYLSALWRTGARLGLHPIEQPFHIHHRLVPAMPVADFEGPADAAVVHLNPDGWGLMSDEQRALVERARVRIGLWVFEMGHVPDYWFPVFDSVDVIWAPSAYCAEVFAARAKVPVEVVPHVVPVPPPGEAADRGAVLAGLGLEADARIVLYVFDGSSYLVRKNPEALVRAFAASGLARRGWRLVLKTKNLGDWPEQAAALTRLVRATAGARLVDRQMSLEAMNALFAAADIYASPHRSEGFGLTVAEAMAMAKPVVATDYGGTRDFLDASCGYPVPARTVKLDKTYGGYTQGGEWGEVDETAFARALAEAAAAVDAGDRTVGERARARIAERLSPEAVARAMREALDRALGQGEGARAA